MKYHFPYLDFCLSYLPSVKYDLASSSVAFLNPLSLDIDPKLLQLRPSQIEAVARETIAQAYGTSANCVALTSGASGANMLVAGVIAATFNKPTLLVESPGYESMTEVPKMFGCQVIAFPRIGCLNSTGDNVDAILDDAISNDAKAVCLTNPHNPTGHFLEIRTLQCLADKLQKLEKILYVNEVYLEFAPLHERSTAAGVSPNVCISSSLTKAYGLGQVRFGWVVGPASFIEDIRQLSLALNGMPSVPNLAYGLAGFRLRNQLRLASASQLSQRLAALERLLVSFCPEHRWHRPAMGGFGLLTLHEIEDDLKFVDDLVKATSVLVMPGTLLGAPGTVRISFGAWNPDFEESATRFAQFAGQYRLRRH